MSGYGVIALFVWCLSWVKMINSMSDLVWRIWVMTEKLWRRIQLILHYLSLVLFEKQVSFCSDLIQWPNVGVPIISQWPSININTLWIIIFDSKFMTMNRMSCHEPDEFWTKLSYHVILFWLTEKSDFICLTLAWIQCQLDNTMTWNKWSSYFPKAVEKKTPWNRGKDKRINIHSLLLGQIWLRIVNEPSCSVLTLFCLFFPIPSTTWPTSNGFWDSFVNELRLKSC